MNLQPKEAEKNPKHIWRITGLQHLHMIPLEEWSPKG